MKWVLGLLLLLAACTTSVEAPAEQVVALERFVDDGHTRIALCGFATKFVPEEERFRYECVEACPDGWDTFGDQWGAGRCIEPVTEEDVLALPVCDRSTPECECVVASRTTDSRLFNETSRCIDNTDYLEYVYNTRQLCILNEEGVEECLSNQ